MEQFLKNFLDDNSVTVGLCDLGRKILKLNNSACAVQQIQPTVQQVHVENQQRQSLAQYFAQQQREYAEQQRRMKEIQQSVINNHQQVYRTAPQQTFYNEQVVEPVVESYVQRMPQQRINQQQKVIINGNMKKVITSAVPARR